MSSAKEAGPPALEVPATTLATRLSTAYFGMSFLLIVISSFLLYWAAVAALHWADDQVLEKRLLTLRSLLQEPELSVDFLTHEVTEDLEGPRRIFMRIVSDADPLRIETPGMSGGLDAKNLPDMSAAPLDEPMKGTVRGEDGREFRYLTMRIPLAPFWQKPSAILQVGADTSLDEGILFWFRMALAAIFVAALITCWLTARYLVGQELAPLRKITAAASRISTETLSYRLDTGGLPAELHQLAQQLNDMLSRLEHAYDGLRQYADNIAHELRTPINRMLLGCEVALLKSRSESDYRESISSNMEECNRLCSMVQSLLFMARADNAQAAAMREEIDLRRELEIVRDFFDAPAREGRLNLQLECEIGLKLAVDRVLFQRAVGNLVLNAIAHTQPGGSVRIRAMQKGSGVAIEVADTGSGISSEHLPHVFERFYRVDKVRSSEEEHLGLGLPLTQSIVRLHGGSVVLESELGRGTRVVMTFPQAS
jgi:two-component system, OmpR family, heavy metal sensor histidine kinase CusS